MKLNLVRNNTFDNQIVIVDGQGRSGKNLISISLTAIKKIANNIGINGNSWRDTFINRIESLFYNLNFKYIS